MGGRSDVWGDGTGTGDPVHSRPSGGAGTRWGDGVEASILQAADAPGRRSRRGMVQRIDAAWRARGPAGRLAAAVGVVLAIALSASWVAHSPAALATGASLVLLVVAALVDVAEHRLPNALLGLAAAPVAAALLLGGSAELVRSAAVGAAVVGAPLLVTHLVSPAGMGFGDVKAGAVLGAALGLLDPQIALLALVLGLTSAATWGLARRARSVAFGPALVVGALLAMVLARLAGVEAVTW
jgi:leader peptidase (prepilin peptidase)/N-methyltransferase